MFWSCSRCRLARTFFAIENADPIAAADDHGSIHAEFAQSVDCRLSDLVCGQFGNERGVNAVVGKRYRDVCFRAAEGCLIILGLYEPHIVLRCQTQHEFSERNDFFHLFNASSTKKLPPTA